MPRTTKPAKSGKSKIKRLNGPDEPRELTRYVSASTQALLWGRAGGRCEFAGCNQVLWRSPVTQEAVNIAEKAHIYSFSSDGPRGNEGITRSDLNGIDNLFLACSICHLKIDQAPDGGRYTVPVLREMKRRHERRIEVVTGIDPSLNSHVILYGASIGEHSSPRLMDEAARAMFPDRYPAEATPISLGVSDSPTQDRSDEFWRIESGHLRSQFDRRVRERLAAHEIDHLSVFALAPQPLLILLGTLLGDITPAEVFQRHREPPSWCWPAHTTTPEFLSQPPVDTNGPPALVLALSATVSRDRIEAVLGPKACVWQITVESPRIDLTKSRAQLSHFRTVVRFALNQIKAVHGQNTPLHVFPVVSAAMAVELGRVRMPKADTVWHVYDQVNARGGFIHAITIPNGDRP